MLEDKVWAGVVTGMIVTIVAIGISVLGFAAYLAFELVKKL